MFTKAASISRLTKIMFRRSSNFCFSSEKVIVSLPNIFVQILVPAHTSLSPFPESHLTWIPYCAFFSARLPKHTAADYFLPRQFVSSQTGPCHASPAQRPLTLQVSGPREICASIRRLDLPALHFRASCRLPSPSRLLVPSTTKLKNLSPFRKSSHIDFMLYKEPVKVSKSLASVRITAARAGIPASPVVARLSFSSPEPAARGIV